MQPKRKIIFICLGNSCRSIMAEALARHFCGARWEAASAGVSPLGQVAPETLKVLAEMGVDTAGLYSKGLNDVDLEGFRAAVNLTEYDLRRYLPESFAGFVLPQPVSDPYGLPLADYRRTREEIILLIRELSAGEKI